MNKKRILEEIEENIIAVGIIIMVIMETMNAICDLFFKAGSGYPEELACYAYVWVAFLCASFCTKRGANIIVDALAKLYPAPVQKVLDYLQYILDVIMSVLIVYGGCLYVKTTIAEGTVGMTGFPCWIVYLAPIAGFGLNIVRDVQKILEINKKSKAVQPANT
ncbi:MAG: TRAP transporter small permease subunit [Eubacteriales bacterium]|nr:TRAP transporter small permease subunit [Eubacteriales bacterium]